MNTKILTALVVAMALVGLTGAASADVITGDASYEYWTGGAIVGDGDEMWNSAMELDLLVEGTTVAESDIGNWMGIYIDQDGAPLTAPLGAYQYGSNEITLNNGQEPGLIDPVIEDFVSTSTSGGMVAYDSEGAFEVLFNAVSESFEANEGFIIHDVELIDSNVVYGSADPLDILDLCGCDIPSCHIKTGYFNWDCVDQAEVQFEDTYTKDIDIGTGIQSGGFAKAELSPLAMALGEGGVTVTTMGTQTITIDITP
ncbi:MAG: hypothetical protein KAT65_25200 [Methanophagales archaeon]|nr:hypothetical protein [Methanophagales archaeon]